MASTVPTIRGSVAGRKPDERDHQRAGVECLRAVVLREACCDRRRSPARRPPGGSRRARRASGRPGPSSPNCSTAFTARSNATHAITFEWVKSRRSPRTSQMPSSGSFQAASRKSRMARWSDPRVRVFLRSCIWRVWCSESSDLAVDVELELLEAGVADPHRRRVLVARQPVDLVLGEPALAARAVHDLQVRGVARDRAQQPVAPLDGFLHVAGRHQRVERERRVAQPAVAVVPVAHAAGPLGERRRGRGDDAAGRRERQRLQRDQRALHQVVPLAVVRGPARPFLPPRSGPPDARGTASIAGGAVSVVRRVPGEHERHLVARAHDELGLVAHARRLRS